MTRYTTFTLCLLAVALISVTLLLPFSVNGTQSDDHALIVVSSYNGTDQNELDKAEDLYDHLISEGYSSDKIEFLTYEELGIEDGDSSTANIQDGFKWIAGEAGSGSEVIIYISDHSHASESDPFYRFGDGNIYESNVSDWLDDITCDSLTYITLGSKSGLIGSELTGANRLVISSMKDNEKVDPDGFDIVRSLENPSADTDNDGEVSFLEAFEAEKTKLTGQTPVLWS